MFKFRISLLLTILSAFKVTQTVLVSIAVVPERYERIGINSPQCGMPYTTKYLHRNTIYIFYDKKCFGNQYKSRIIHDFSKPGQRGKYRISSNRVHKGKVVGVGEAPWTVFVGFTNRTFEIINKRPKQDIGGILTFVRQHRFVPVTYFCTGILITFQWVMTAASCLNILNKPEHNVVYVFASAGSNKPIAEEIILINQNKIFIHPGFNPKNSYFDIALVKLQEKFTERKNNQRNYLINTICIPEYDFNPTFHKENVTAFGFGHMAITNPQPLQKVDLQIPGPRIGWNGFEIPISSDSPATCAGDVGGPLVQYLYEDQYDLYRSVLVGVTKDNGPCSEKIAINYFLPVSRYTNFILQTIERN